MTRRLPQITEERPTKNWHDSEALFVGKAYLNIIIQIMKTPWDKHIGVALPLHWVAGSFFWQWPQVIVIGPTPTKPLTMLQSRSNLYTDQNYIKAVFLLDIVLMMYDLQQVDLEMWAICENKASRSFKLLTFSKDWTWQTMVTPRRAKVVWMNAANFIFLIAGW